MSFDDIPALPPPIHPDGAAYAHRIIAATRAAQAHLPVVIDQAYGADYWQKVDVYLPREQITNRLPVFCFLYGGAWVNGCKEWVGFMAPPLVDLPAIFVALSYRHAPLARFPAQLDDVVEAIAWVHRNIARYGGDPGRIYLGGHSAGGHLAALATLRHDVLAAHGLSPGIVRGCFPISAPYDLASDDRLRRQKVLSFLSTLSDIPAASPIRHVGGNAVPFVITYGTADLVELPPQARQMAQALRAAGGPTVNAGDKMHRYAGVKMHQ